MVSRDQLQGLWLVAMVKRVSTDLPTDGFWTSLLLNDRPLPALLLIVPNLLYI